MIHEVQILKINMEAEKGRIKNGHACPLFIPYLLKCKLFSVFLAPPTHTHTLPSPSSLPPLLFKHTHNFYVVKTCSKLYLFVTIVNII